MTIHRNSLLFFLSPPVPGENLSVFGTSCTGFYVSDALAGLPIIQPTRCTNLVIPATYKFSY